MLASRTADLDALRLNPRIVQIKLGQTRGTRDNHGKPSFWQFFDIMMNGMEKIKNKMEGINKMSNVKFQSSTICL
jgi:hypothetical protein